MAQTCITCTLCKQEDRLPLMWKNKNTLRVTDNLTDTPLNNLLLQVTNLNRTGLSRRCFSMIHLLALCDKDLNNVGNKSPLQFTQEADYLVKFTDLIHSSCILFFKIKYMFPRYGNPQNVPQGYVPGQFISFFILFFS